MSPHRFRDSHTTATRNRPRKVAYFLTLLATLLLIHTYYNGLTNNTSSKLISNTYHLPRRGVERRHNPLPRSRLLLLITLHAISNTFSLSNTTFSLLSIRTKFRLTVLTRHSHSLQFGKTGYRRRRRAVGARVCVSVRRSNERRRYHVGNC